jgi:hypothetical protein
MSLAVPVWLVILGDAAPQVADHLHGSGSKALRGHWTRLIVEVPRSDCDVPVPSPASTTSTTAPIVLPYGV